MMTCNKLFKSVYYIVYQVDKVYKWIVLISVHKGIKYIYHTFATFVLQVLLLEISFSICCRKQRFLHELIQIFHRIIIYSIYSQARVSFYPSMFVRERAGRRVHSKTARLSMWKILCEKLKRAVHILLFKYWFGKNLFVRMSRIWWWTLRDIAVCLSIVWTQ